MLPTCSFLFFGRLSTPVRHIAVPLAWLTEPAVNFSTAGITLISSMANYLLVTCTVGYEYQQDTTMYKYCGRAYWSESRRPLGLPTVSLKVDFLPPR